MSSALLYVTVFGFVYSSANAFFERNYALSVVMLLAWVLMLRVMGYRSTRRFYGERSGFLFLLVLVVSLLSTAFTTDSTDTSSYIAIALIMATGYVTSTIIDVSQFARGFIAVMVFLAFVSLVMYGVALIYPSLIFHFPLRNSTSSFDYYDAFFHAFLVSNQAGEEGSVFSRNNGFAWEPGAYQIFLNLALAFILARVSRSGPQRGDRWKVLVLVVTVVTTVSTTGYFTSLLLMLAFWREFGEILLIRNSPRKRSAIQLVGAVSLIATYFVFARGSESRFGTKVQSEFSNGGDGVIRRLSLNLLGEVPISWHSVFGYGFQWWVDADLRIWNSVLHTFLSLGFIFTVGLLLAYWRFAAMFPKPYVMYAILIFAFSTESLFWRPVFAYFAFVGIVQRIGGHPNPVFLDPAVELERPSGVAEGYR